MSTDTRLHQIARQIGDEEFYNEFSAMLTKAISEGNRAEYDMTWAIIESLAQLHAEGRIKTRKGKVWLVAA